LGGLCVTCKNDPEAKYRLIETFLPQRLFKAVPSASFAAYPRPEFRIPWQE